MSGLALLKLGRVHWLMVRSWKACSTVKLARDLLIL